MKFVVKNYRINTKRLIRAMMSAVLSVYNKKETEHVCWVYDDYQTARDFTFAQIFLAKV